MREQRPELLNGLEIKAQMKVHAYTKPGLVDFEESTKPSAKEANHLGIAVCEVDLAISLAALARVEGGSSGKERLIAEHADAHDAFAIQLLDLTKFPLSEWLTSPLRPVAPP